MRYADIIIDISHERIDKSFQYRIPRELSDKVSVGSPVLVPFGKAKKARQGYVVGISKEPKLDEEQIRDIISIEEKRTSVEASLIELAIWMRRHYGGTFSQCLKTVIPVKRKVSHRKGQENCTAADQTQGIEALKKEPPLNSDQKKVICQFKSDYSNGIHKNYLLYGVTGSGKTRVYIEMIREVISRGGSAIVLIPEISLTRQNIQRFRAGFGEMVCFLHSRLSEGERYEVYEKVSSGRVRIVLGPRSALFVPIQKLGLIIVDEEHESSYKSEKMPKYHAREVALKRAAIEGASVVLGSATPSIESVQRVLKKQYTFLKLSHRAGNSSLPKIHIADMRQELKEGNASIFSLLLREKIERTLEKGEQAILFLNRRGMAGFVSCRACGYVAKCPHCDVSLHQHRDGSLRCHYCGYKKNMPDKCPECGSYYFGGFKIGTQGVEGQLKKLYPAARILRMDADTTRHKGDHEKILSAFADRKADILLGTQMIVKGHDFPGVSLVGILAADMSLNSSDFGGSERTFDLLIQAAGRAGRGDIPGEVVIQTYQPDHYAIKMAARHDIDGFMKRELSFRSLMSYPPEAHMLLIQTTAKSQSEGFKASGIIKKEIISLPGTLFTAGPSEAVIARIKDRFRFAVYIKSKSYDELIVVKDKIEELVQREDFKKSFPHVRTFFDFDPMGVY